MAGLVWHQRLEKDEGYLAEGAWLVANGRVPYRDFVFPQQPYFALVYGALARLVGPSLLFARSVSAALFLALAALVFVFVRRQARDPGLARWAALFFCFNTLSLYWYTRARQYALADLLLFAGLLLVAEARREAPSRRGCVGCLLGGVAAGAAAHVRLLLGPAAVALAVAAGLGADKRWSWARGAAFVGGVLLGSLPFLWLFALDPAGWLSDTYGLQVLLRPSFEPGELLLRVRVTLGEFLSRPELSLIVALAAVALVPGRDAPRGAARLALVVLVAVAGAVLLAHPTQTQYLVETLPCLSVLAACGVGRLLGRLDERQPSLARLLPVGLLVFVVGFGGYRAAGRILYDQHNDPRLGVAGLLAYQEHMRQYLRSGDVRSDDRVLHTWWPGYLLVEGVSPYPGAELGRPAERGVGRISREGFAARGLRHPDQIAEDLRAGVPRFVVTGYQAPENAAALLAARYRRRAHFGVIEVYERCGSGDGGCRP